MPLADNFIFDWYFPAAFIWGFLVILSLAGWGRACGRWLITDKTAKIGWGMSAALGMAIYLVLAGVMLMLCLFSASFVALFLLVGLVLFMGQALSVRGDLFPFAPSGTIWKVGLGLFCVAAVLTYAGAVAMRIYNENDDIAAYFPLTKMALDTGTFYDPFSYRLLGALGGQLILNALVTAFFPWKFTYLVEMGIVALIMLGMTWEMVRGNDNRTWKARLFIGAFALTFPIFRVNTASELTGVVLFLIVFQALEWVTARHCRGWRSAVLLGTVFAAVSTLRCPYIFASAVLGAGFIFWHLSENKQDRKEMGWEILLIFIATIILISPWWIVTYRSSGAFLFPLFKGTQQPTFKLISNSMSFLDTLNFIGNFLLTYNFIPLFLPACFLRQGRPRQLLFILGGLIFMFNMALLSQFTFGIPIDLYRYLLPLTLAFCLYSMGFVARQILAAPPVEWSRPLDLRVKSAIVLGIAALCYQVFFFVGSLQERFSHFFWALDARHEFITIGGNLVTDDEAAGNYQKAFTQVPPHSRILIALDYPYLLDYQKYKIYNIDQVGAASPSPGMPYFKGPEAVKEYLASQDIRYVAHVHFDFSPFLHSRQAIKRNLEGTVPVYQFFASFEKDFCDNIDQLSTTNRVLFDSPDIQIIDLKSADK